MGTAEELQSLAISALIGIACSILFLAAALTLTIFTFRAQRKTVKNISAIGDIIQKAQRCMLNRMPSKAQLSDMIANIEPHKQDSEGERSSKKKDSRRRQDHSDRTASRSREERKRGTAEGEPAYDQLSLTARLPSYLRPGQEAAKKSREKPPDEPPKRFADPYDEKYHTLAGLHADEILPMVDDQPKRGRNWDDEPAAAPQNQARGGQRAGPRNWDDDADAPKPHQQWQQPKAATKNWDDEWGSAKKQPEPPRRGPKNWDDE